MMELCTHTYKTEVPQQSSVKGYTLIPLQWHAFYGKTMPDMVTMWMTNQ